MKEDNMGNGKDVIITVCGHEKQIDKFSVRLFDNSGDNYSDDNISNAEAYCDTINSLELNGDSWLVAKIISENTQYTLDTFIPLRFDSIMVLDDRAVQKLLREVDSIELAKALKGADETIQEKIFKNMSKRAVQMLKEDMEYMGPVRKKDVEKSQENILNILRHLEETGEIVISHSQGEIIE
jgi:lysine/ornithine N-monooxygenase